MTTIHFVVMGLILVSLIAWLNIASRRIAKNGEWRLIGGGKARRWINGRWQYRDTSSSENAEFADKKVW